MKFAERKDFQYDPELFRLSDTQTALSIHAEYVKVHSPRNPLPKFLEVDRRTAKYDTLWHMPLDERTAFSRVIDMPAIIQFARPDWRLTRVGIVPQQQCKVWMANKILADPTIDWFPQRGDMMYWNGYRHMIINVVLAPEAYWQQTNVWLGLMCETAIPADGDARPLLNVGEAAPRELSNTRPLPEA